MNPLASMPVSARLEKLTSSLAGAGCDCLLVTSLSNVRYLTGFSGSAAMLLVSPDGALLTTDGRYRTQAAEQLARAQAAVEVSIGGLADQHQVLAERVAPGSRLGLEAAAVTWSAQRAWSDRLAGVELVPTSGVVERGRRVKDEAELQRMGTAAQVADAALADVLGMLGEGPTESELALALDSAMRRRGAEGSAFETIVASGPNGAKPHHRPSPRRIGHHELVVIDFGATVDGYRSDMTRTFSVGEPSDQARRMYEVVLDSQAAGVAAVRAGVPAVAVDATCREVVARAGWSDAFVHSTGHGVGLDIHEAPAVAATSADTLEEASVVTVEPGVYLPEVGGVRIEDTVVVTAEGCEALTRFPKELVVA
jgi:Xaa-Pro aminopeptidase